MKKSLLCFITALFISASLFADWDIGELLLAFDGAEHDEFGKSVSISGNYAVIGALCNDENGSNSGSAYIFYYDGTNWYQQAKLIASDGADLDIFGKSVSISGDYVVIGATGNDDNGSCSGSAYIFSRSDTLWTEQAKLTASDAATENNFGYSVSISGDYAVIGAIGNDENGTHAGAAYIFHRSGTIWSQQAKLLASDGIAHDIFGKSVAIFGDYAIIGAGSVDDNGFCYIFKRSGTSWYQQAKLVASDGASHDLFGYSVSIFDDYAVIGACGDDDNGSCSGSAYIFSKSDTIWTEQAKLTASDGTADNYFGYSVSIFDDYAAIGAYSDDDNGISSGSAYIFNRSDTTWYQQTKLLASDGAAFDKFGRSVSISGNVVIIGADGNSDNGISSGSAYVFQNDDLPSVIADFEANPLETKLIGNFPNPFNTTTTISFYLTAEDAEIVIYNIKGQKVKVLDCPDYIGNNEQAAESLSQYSVVWDGTDENYQPVSSGVYFYRLKVGNNLSGTKKMLLLK
ncbi:MAG: T9SS type A sorting domain-containing protein [Bacteroidales bacterium]|nr:T9SS type A sorting domain-containing protein [Bacteroidales bacterium]